jgi:hypothetical protein
MNFVTYDVVDDKEHIFEVDTLRNEKVIVKNILLHQNFNLDVDADAGSPYTSYSRAKKFNSTYSK